jgi:glutamine cyclotransferase
MRFSQFAFLFLAVACLWGCKEKEKPAAAAVDSLQLKYTVRTTWAHDQRAFTEGLEIYDGKLFESTGQEGESWIGIIDINTGKPDKKIILDKQYFGEGITILNNKIYQLTYKTKIGFIYDAKTFKKTGQFTFESPEGWGMTHDNVNLIMSDGTDKLTYLDTVSLKAVKTVKVTDEKGPVQKVNELEYVDGYIFANIWESNTIIKIDPKTGKVVGRLELSALVRDARTRFPQAEVLNGIAYHPTTKLLLVTGKYWPVVYVIKVN